MYAPQLVARRTFLADMGRGAFALALISVAGCGGSGGSASASAAASVLRSAAASSGDGSASPPAASGGPASAGASDGGSGAGGTGATWARVNLGFVSAYVLVRGGEAAIVDTGLGGSADAIHSTLEGVGLDWSAVGHLILTHKHGDHVGSAADVLAAAPDAVGYAGAEDIGAISLPRPLTAVGDGDSVFGLSVITTPGHTPGSISIYDPVGGFVVAGDAIRTEAGKPALPNAQFTEDMEAAKASVAKLGALTFETLLVGHGDPIESGASTAVAALGAGD